MGHDILSELRFKQFVAQIQSVDRYVIANLRRYRKMAQALLADFSWKLILLLNVK